MKKALIVSVLAGGALFAAASVYAVPQSGVICQPKTSADAAKIRYTGNRIMNTDTGSSASVNCSIGLSDGPHATVLDNNSSQNITCFGFYYVTGILSNAGSRTSSGTGIANFDWSPVGIGEVWSVGCTLPPAAGSSESQMSSIEMLQ